jgi:hypothetical protein
VEGALPLGLASLECVEVTRSRVIRRICYDELRQYMVVDIEGRHREFCQVERETAEAFLHAKSLAQFFRRLEGSIVAAMGGGRSKPPGMLISPA